MKRFFFMGLVLNAVLSAALWFANSSLALGYAIGAFAMLANLLFMAAGRLWGMVGFIALMALTYWVTRWLPGTALYLYAVGLASPVLVALLGLLSSLPIDTKGSVWLDRRHGS